MNETITYYNQSGINNGAGKLPSHTNIRGKEAYK